VNVALFLPHEMLSFLHTAEPAAFTSKLIGDESPKDFWKELEARKDPRLDGHPMKDRERWREFSIPIAWHGDGVPCLGKGGKNTKSFEVYSWSSILSSGNSLSTKIYCWGYFGDNKDGEVSLVPVWQKVMWSLDWAHRGVWPNCDEHGTPYPPRSLEAKRAGTPLAGGYFLTLYTFKQDLDHLAREYGLADYRSNYPCELCGAHKLLAAWGMNFNNFNAGADWMSTIRTAAEWNASHPAPHPLFQWPWITCLNIEPDEAHALHLGVSQHTLGSVLWLLVYSCDRLDGSPQQNLDTVWAAIRDEYRRLKSPTQITGLKLSSFHDPNKPYAEFPCLHIKAAETKDLVEPLRAVWERYRSPGEEDHGFISNMFEFLCAMQSILHIHRKKALLPRPAALDFRNACRSFLREYSKLANSADAERVLLFATVPKHHWVWHMGDRGMLINPRKSCCLLDEDYIGRLKEVVASCAHGTALHVIQAKVAEQYRVGFWITTKFGV